MGARDCSLSRMSSSPKLSLPPDTHTITRSPSSIMLKSMMALPTWWHRRFSSLWVSRSIILFPLSPLTGFHANGDFAVVKNFQFGDFDAHAQHAGQLHQPVGQFANQALQQIDVFGGALVDDDLAHLAVVQHTVDVVVVRQQRLGAQAEFGVDLNRLRRGFFKLQNAQVGVKTQTGEREGLGTKSVG